MIPLEVAIFLAMKIVADFFVIVFVENFIVSSFFSLKEFYL